MESFYIYGFSIVVSLVFYNYFSVIYTEHYTVMHLTRISAPSAQRYRLVDITPTPLITVMKPLTFLTSFLAYCPILKKKSVGL
jgi:hypothetical protein